MLAQKKEPMMVPLIGKEVMRVLRSVPMKDTKMALVMMALVWALKRLVPLMVTQLAHCLEPRTGMETKTQMERRRAMEKNSN